MGLLGWLNDMGVLGWFNGVGELFGNLNMPNALCMLFILRPGVLSRTLSHIWCKFNLPVFLFNVGLLT